MVTVAAIRKTVGKILERIDAIEAQYNTLAATCKDLAQYPMNEASPYWHAERYLYLIHRTHDGFRPRKYVGNDPDKVQEALESIERFKEHKKATGEMQYIKNQLMDVQFGLQQCLRKLENKDI